MIKLDAIFSDDQVPGRFWLKFFLFQYVGPMGFSMYRVVCMGVCQGFEIMTISSSDVPRRNSEVPRRTRRFLGGSRRFLGGSRRFLGGSSEDLGGSSEDLGGSSEELGGSRVFIWRFVKNPTLSDVHKCQKGNKSQTVKWLHGKVTKLRFRLKQTRQTDCL